MALLGKKSNKNEKDKNKNDTEDKKAKFSEDLTWVILKPHISEKSLVLTDKKVYVFEIDKNANRTQVKKAIKQIYNVEPIKVNISIMPRKRKMSWKTRKIGISKQVKKAYVYLKKDDSISFV